MASIYAEIGPNFGPTSAPVSAELPNFGLTVTLIPSLTAIVTLTMPLMGQEFIISRVPEVEEGVSPAPPPPLGPEGVSGPLPTLARGVNRPPRFQ